MIQPHQYRPLEAQTQHDAWGIGAVVNISGQKTHRAVEDALRIVEKLEHRTGKDADGTTGDGVGIMTQIPHAFLKKTAQQAGKTLPEAGDYGVAMIFFSAGPAHAYAQPESAGDDPGTRGAGPAVLAGCAGLPGDSERKSAEQYAGDYTVLYPPPGKDRARSGF